jgi:hypothetical protein
VHQVGLLSTSLRKMHGLQNIKIEENLSLCLNKHHTMNIYRGGEVYFQALLTYNSMIYNLDTKPMSLSWLVGRYVQKYTALLKDSILCCHTDKNLKCHITHIVLTKLHQNIYWLNACTNNMCILFALLISAPWTFSNQAALLPKSATLASPV